VRERSLCVPLQSFRRNQNRCIRCPRGITVSAPNSRDMRTCLVTDVRPQEVVSNARRDPHAAVVHGSLRPSVTRDRVVPEASAPSERQISPAGIRCQQHKSRSYCPRQDAAGFCRSLTVFNTSVAAISEVRLSTFAVSGRCCPLRPELRSHPA